MAVKKTQRRGRGEGSVYQRSRDGRWVAVIDLGWSGGQRVRHTVTASTKVAVMRRMRERRRELDAGIVRDGSTTVQSWLTYWLDEIATKRVRDSTLRTYRAYTDTWLIPHLGQHRLDRLTPEHIRALYRAMDRAGRSPATIRQVDAILGRALKVATIEGKIPRNPCDAIEVSGRSGSHGKLTLEESMMVLRVVMARPDRARWYAALLLGLRQSEALGLAWEDIDLEAGTLTVRQVQTYTPGAGFGLGPPKSSSSRRTIPVGALPEVVKALAELEHAGPLVWGPRHARADYGAWQAILAEAEVTARPLHAARATTASLLSELGVAPKVISEILGHARVQVTERHYIHGDQAVHAAALALLDRLLLRAIEA